MTFTAPDGSYTIGGGSDNWGQTVTEDNFRALVTPPTPTPGNLMEQLQHALSMLPKESLDQFAPWLGLTDVFTSVQDAIQQIVDSFGTKPLTQVIQDVHDAIDGLINGLVGWADTGYTPAQLEAISADVAKSIADISAIVQALVSTTGYAGTAVVIDFSTYPDGSSLGSDWDQWYWGTGSATLGIANGRAVLSGTASNRFAGGLYLGAETKTSYQKIGAVFSTKPSMGVFGGSKSKNRIRGRLSSDQQTSVDVEFTANSVTLGCYVSDAWTTFATVTSGFTFKPGAVYWLECGTVGGLRIFRVWENNRVLITYTDSAVVSSEGSDYRSIGITDIQYSDGFRPAEIASIAFYDNNPAALTGCGWRVFRASTSTATQSSGDNQFPDDWFDTIDYMTSDLVYNPTLNKVTVPATGWYLINVNQFSTNSIVGAGYCSAALVVNGAIAQKAAPKRQNATNTGFNGVFIQYLHEGDYVRPAYSSSWDAIDQLAGEASGVETYWSGVFLGNNKKPLAAA